MVLEELGNLSGIEHLYLFGSWAARYQGETGRAPNDIDVLVIGAPDRDQVYEAGERAEKRLRVPVQVTIRTPNSGPGLTTRSWRRFVVDRSSRSWVRRTDDVGAGPNACWAAEKAELKLAAPRISSPPSRIAQEKPGRIFIPLE